MLVIETKFLEPTHTKGTRVTAWTANGHRVVISHDHGLSDEESHARAADALCKKFVGLAGNYVVGDTRKGRVWVRVEGSTQYALG